MERDIDRDNEESIILKVELPDSLENPYITLRVRRSSIASDVIKHNFANKLNLSSQELQHHNLVFVCVLHMASGRPRYVMRTMKPGDRIIAVSEEVCRKQEARRVREGIVGNGYSSCWYFKDCREPPLDFDNGDLSGNSSSEGEYEMTHADQAHLLQLSGERATMLRRSTKDINLWKRRVVVLADKLWCLNRKDEARPRALSRVLQGNIAIDEEVRGYNYINCIAITVGMGNLNTIYLRTADPEEKRVWVEELKSRIFTNTDNDVISMGEVILCDEVAIQSRRVWDSLGECPHRAIVSGVWDQIYQRPYASSSINSSAANGSADAIKPRYLEYGEDLDSDVECSSHSIMNLKALMTSDDCLAEGASSNCNSPIGGNHSPKSSFQTAASSPKSSRAAVLTTNDSNDDNNNNSNNNSTSNFDCNNNHNSAQLYIKSWNYKQITFNPCRTLVHDFHLTDSNSFEIISCLADVARYKELFRSEVSVSCRHMWQSVLRIFQKYLLAQIILIGKVKDKEQRAKIRQIRLKRRRRGSSALAYSAISSEIGNAGLSVSVRDSFGRGSLSETRSRLNSVDLQQRESEDSSSALQKPLQPPQRGQISSLVREKLRQRKIRSNTSYAELSEEYNAVNGEGANVSEEAQLIELADQYWDVSSDVLLKLHRNIFINIRRQIAGMDNPDTNSRENYDLTTSQSTREPAAVERPSVTSSFLSIFTGSSEPTTSNSSKSPAASDGDSKSRWSFWSSGGSTATVSNNGNNNSNSPSRGRARSSSYESGYTEAYEDDESGQSSSRLNEDPFISVAKLFPKHFRSKYLRECDISSGAMYEIIDINKRPRISLFDALVSELEAALESSQSVIDIENFSQAFTEIS